MVEIVEQLDLSEMERAVSSGARYKFEERAHERFEQASAAYQDQVEKREARAVDSGKPARGRAPTPPQEGAQDKDQINLTDEESRIMKTSGGGIRNATTPNWQWIWTAT